MLINPEPCDTVTDLYIYIYKCNQVSNNNIYKGLVGVLALPLEVCRDKHKTKICLSIFYIVNNDESQMDR